jgi:IMP dehydrogenase
MKTISGLAMCQYIVSTKGLAICNRFGCPILGNHKDYQLDIFKNIKKQYTDAANYFSISIGVKDNDFELFERFCELGGKIVTIDIAHGDSLSCWNMIKKIRKSSYKPLIIAGNIATSEAAKRLWHAGADVVKVGIGGGSLCTTRVTTGNGIPQMSALMDVAEVKESGKYLISDGGIKLIGDFTKALCFADMVMAGSFFAGTFEAPGDIIDYNGKKYKSYVGSSTHKTIRKEGVESIVECKGSSSDVLTSILEGIASGCSYQGCYKVQELQDHPVFVESSQAGTLEATPHVAGIILK